MTASVMSVMLGEVSHATTGEMASAKAAAHMNATAEPAPVSNTSPAHAGFCIATATAISTPGTAVYFGVRAITSATLI
jgi:hypothetical protein